MSARYVTLDELTPVLDWLTSQRPESAHAHFGVFRVGFKNPEVLGYSFGASDAMRRLNKFGGGLAAAVRCTDIIARDLTDFWIVTPECNPEVVGCRLCEIVSAVNNLGLDVVACSVGAYVFPLKDVDFGQASGREIIDRLKSIPPHFNFEPAHDCRVSWMRDTADKLDDWHSWVGTHCHRRGAGIAAAHA